MKWTACVLVAALGCGRSTPPAQPPSPPPAEPAPLDEAGAAALADELVAVLSDMATITGLADCQAMGTQLGALFDRSAPVFVRARALDDDPESARRVKAAMDARAPAVAPLVDAMGPGLVRCRDDASVMAAMERMPTL